MSLLKKGGTTKGIALPRAMPSDVVPMPAAPAAQPLAAVPLSSPPTRTKLDTRGLQRKTNNIQTLPHGTLLQNRYLVEGMIGVGGMSLVYRGRDLRFKDVVRPCAIKEMFQSAPNSETRQLTIKNFEREAGLLATLNHPAIPKVFDFFEEQGKIYLILELVAGWDLESTLERHGGPLTEAQVGGWAMQICDVVTYLHLHEPEPIIFRDMKPSNVIVTPDDRIVLIDFGIARVLQPNQRKGTMIGTEGYAPPEQYRGIADPRGDVYALGATMHHLLTNCDPRTETPFTFQERPVRHFNPLVSLEMEAVIMQTLHYDPEQRPQTMGEFKALLQQVLGVQSGVPASTTPAVATPLHSNVGASTAVVWKFTCEDEVRSSPIVRDGSLYIGAYDTNLYCLNAGSGEFHWKRATQGGISSSPTTWNELVIVGSEDGLVYALDTKHGMPKWTFRTARPIRSSPRVEDRIVYVGSDDQHLYALDGQNGRLLWKHRAWMPIRSSAAIKNGAVYVGSSDGHVYALDAFNGGLRWKQKTQQGVVSTPTVGDGLIFVGSMDGNVYALDAEAGRPAWRFKTGHYVNASPTLAGSHLFVGGVDGTMYALEAKTGKVVWKYETGSQIISTARVDDGKLYFGAADTFLYCLDSTTGMLVWKFATGAPVVSSPTVHNGLVFFGSMDHHVYAVKA
ncbi:MAG: PQQ-binding-like beta-propeller repeat protein [Herpetosiphonaceae bacterium]|nr:PQQ-binding-like beta-propeller repeat protein [Herpetosiphonaceae bacterium]